MRVRKTFLFVLVLNLAWYFIPNLVFADEPAELTADQWREDLHFMAERAAETHKNLYHTISRESFDSVVASIDHDIPNLNRNQIVVRLAELVSAIGDGHTSLSFHLGSAAKFHRYPLQLYPFKDGLFVRGAMPGNEQAIGARVVAIDGMPIEEVFQRLKAISPRDNEWSQQLFASFSMIIPEILNGLGIAGDPANTAFTLENRTGTKFTISPKPVTLEQHHASRSSDDYVYAHELSDNPIPLWLQNPESDLWFEYLKKPNALYVQYEHILNTENESFADFTERMLEETDRLSVDKLIIDLRTNGGGNNMLNKPLIHGIIARPKINQEGKLFVITSKNTFSAASHLVTYLEAHTNALFVGEPMGGSPNHYGDARSITLPNSGLIARFSSLYWQNSTPFERRDVHGPDLSARQTSAEYFDNDDPSMRAIMEYKSQAPLTERVIELVTSGSVGYNQAREELVSFVENPVHEYISVTDDLNALGYRLLGQREIETAVAIFKLNTEIYPKFANTWDSYAEGLAMKGDTSNAIINYKKSLDLNPQNSNAETMIARLSGN